MAVNINEASDEWRLPGFTELEQLGTGTFGRVVLARQDNTGHVVAVKYLFSRFATDPAYLSAFRQEALALHRVSSPHVVKLYEFFETPQGAAIVMEAINGVSLRSVLQAEGALEPEAALAVLKGSLLGLAAAHSANVVHRDYKPGNVLVAGTGESKLVDFGTAVLAGERGPAVGTPAYMAPEQWSGGQSTPATDVYAATCVFFQCVAGHRPYQADDTEVLRTLHEHAPIPFGEVPQPVHEIVALGMAKEPSKRPVDALMFVAELERVARAGYGDDWERKGWSRLAKATGVLVAVTPLALLGAGTAAAPGVAAAGTGAVAASTGGIAAGLKIAVGVVAATAAVVGSVVVFSDPSSPPPQSPPTSQQAVALKVAMKTRTGPVPGTTLQFQGQYPEVTGGPDQAWSKRVNDALTAPIDEWNRETGPGAAELAAEHGGGPYVLTTKVEVRMQTEKYLSVRYEHGLENAPHPTWNMGRSAVLIDLTGGNPVAPADLFRPGMFSDQGMLALSDLLWPDHDQGCGLKTWTPIKPADLAGPGERKVFPTFTPAEVELTINFNRLGFETACGVQTMTLPYDRLSDLLNPELVAGLTGGKTAKGTSAPPPAQGLTDVSVGALTLHLPSGWSVQAQGLEKVIVAPGCPDPKKYFNCKYVLVTDNAQESAEQPAYRPGEFYRRSAGGRACNAAGRKDLRQEGDAAKTTSATAPVGGATAAYEEWTIQCVPRGQTGGSGDARVTQRIWFVADRQIAVMDEWRTPGVEELLRTATVS
ncbi:protein kinase [Amycolatopsis sp. BJA-103]|uniref:protein kinase domain-containing protein n=1 Tax=Amycolatopsis sp. BJA-103 TaxID=1911175 RepID=UPI000C76AA63|nr:protein kinase [Amycolatopsis sp. BJA-103]AUI62741.1 serine/threonine protein kinase [Amycolatopsis sp. BJA-103]PNE18581.1 serine/threonine protein kinase [Amycolatopsis sp. BJA-103]